MEGLWIAIIGSYLVSLFFGSGFASYFDLDWWDDLSNDRNSIVERFKAFLKVFILIPFIGIFVAIVFYFMILNPIGHMLSWMPD